MGEPLPSASAGRQMNHDACGTRTETYQECPPENNTPTLHLRLNQPKGGSKVKWTTDTVDNEFMGKKKSKCCCIYEKPKVFGESSSSSEDEEGDDGCTPHCKGHKKKCYRKLPHKHDDHHDHDDHSHGGGAGPGPNSGMQTV